MVTDQDHEENTLLSLISAKEDSVRALIDAIIYPGRDFRYAWDNACLYWDRFGEAPSRIGILEAALLEAIELALDSQQRPLSEEEISRLKSLKLLAIDKESNS